MAGNQGGQPASTAIASSHFKARGASIMAHDTPRCLHTVHGGTAVNAAELLASAALLLVVALPRPAARLCRRQRAPTMLRENCNPAFLQASWMGRLRPCRQLEWALGRSRATAVYGW